jgi:hypothetical protein
VAGGGLIRLGTPGKIILRRNMKTLIAIDPGASGGIALRDPHGAVEVHKMPGTPRDILDLLDDLTIQDAKMADLQAVVENVGGYRPGNSAPSAVKFARHCGHLDMALIASEIPHERVAPSVWMWAVLKTVPSDKTERKNAIKMEMQRLYPKIKVTLWSADALGMLTYLKGKEG